MVTIPEFGFHNKTLSETLIFEVLCTIQLFCSVFFVMAILCVTRLHNMENSELQLQTHL